MSGTVTVPGVSGSTVALSFVGTANLGLAQQIANALDAAKAGGTLVVDENYTGGTLPSVPAGATLELILSTTVSGAVSVPAAPPGVPEVLVLPFGPGTGDETGDPHALTISGSSALTVIGGGPGSLTIQDPNSFVVGEGVGPTDSVTATFTIADSPYNVVMGQGFETVIAGGTGTVTGGPGTDFIDVTGAFNTVFAGSGTTTVDTASFKSEAVGGSASVLSVFDTGFLNTVTGGSGTTNVTAAGSSLLTFGGTGSLNFLDTGVFDTISSGTGSTAVTAGGVEGVVFGSPSSADPLTVNGAGGFGDTVAFGSAGGVFSSSTASSNDLLFAGIGSVSVSAGNTTNDTIVGGSGALTVGAGSASGLLVFGPVAGTGMDFIGGSGSATVVGQAGADTISGGSGPLIAVTGPNETLSAAGGSGGTTLFGANGADIGYTGSAGSLLFVAGVGNDTLNASGSSTDNTYWAAVGTPAGNSLVGGSGDNTFAAGTGPDTFSGGAADNAYVFISSVLGGSAQTDVLTNFLTGNSNVLLTGGISTVSASTGGSGAGAFTTLTLSDNTQITFLGVSSASQLTGHIFTG